MKSILDYLKTQDRKQDQAISGIDNMVDSFIPALNDQTADLEAYINNKVKNELNSSPEFPLDVIINPKYGWQKYGLSGHYAIKSNLTSVWKELIRVNGKGLFLGAYNHTWLNYNESGTSGTLYYKIVVDGVDLDSVSFGRSSYDQMTGWGDVQDGKIALPQVWPSGTSTASNQRMPTGASNVGITGQTYITNIGSFVPFKQSLVVKATYSGTASSSDSIYNFDVAVRLLS